jgi:hypothetical protein
VLSQNSAELCAKPTIFRLCLFPNSDRRFKQREVGALLNAHTELTGVLLASV